MKRARIVVLSWVLPATLFAFACNRNIESFNEGEEPEPPDLARIFPAPGDTPGARPGAQPTPTRSTTPTASPDSGDPITGTITVAPEVADGLSSDAVVFVIARGDAPGPPVAVLRIGAPQFPLDFEIGAANVMMPGAAFQGPLRISARYDTDGNAISRSPGDLQGELGSPVDAGRTGVSILLDQQYPFDAPEPSTRSQTASAGDSGSITGVVRLGAGAASPGGGVLFVIARSGPRRGPPLAVHRIDSPTFPVAFEVGQAQVMVPGRVFEGPIELTARLDEDGDAMTKGASDLEGRSPGVFAPGAAGIEIELNRTGDPM